MKMMDLKNEPRERLEEELRTALVKQFEHEEDDDYAEAELPGLRDENASLQRKLDRKDEEFSKVQQEVYDLTDKLAALQKVTA